MAPRGSPVRFGARVAYKPTRSNGPAVYFHTDSDVSSGRSLRSVYRYSPVHDDSFHWLEAGRENEHTLVLVHGFLAHSMAYRRVIETLAEEYRVVVPDLPAHGRDQTYRSKHLRPEIYDLIDWFDCLLETVAEPEGAPVTVVGHSLGALLSFVAAREQDRFHPIDQVVLVSPGIRIGVPPWTSRILNVLPAGLAKLGANKLGMRVYEPIQWRKSRMDGDELKEYLGPLKQKDRLDFMLDLGADLLSEPDRLPGAHRVGVPTMLITGEKDHLVPVETVELINSVIPDSRLTVFDGVGHCPMEDSPERFAELVLDFVKPLEQAEVIPGPGTDEAPEGDGEQKEQQDGREHGYQSVGSSAVAE